MPKYFANACAIQSAARVVTITAKSMSFQILTNCRAYGRMQYTATLSWWGAWTIRYSSFCFFRARTTSMELSAGPFHMMVAMVWSMSRSTQAFRRWTTSHSLARNRATTASILSIRTWILLWMVRIVSSFNHSRHFRFVAGFEQLRKLDHLNIFGPVWTICNGLNQLVRIPQTGNGNQLFTYAYVILFLFCVLAFHLAPSGPCALTVTSGSRYP